MLILNDYGLQRCRACTLRPGTTQRVDGSGPCPATVFLLGEGPGEQEDKEGRPFVGQSGQYLQECIRVSGLGATSVRIGNVVRCRPPGNRKPTTEEMAACSVWTELELDLTQPDLVVALGGTAMAYFFPGYVLPKKAKVGDFVGKTFAYWKGAEYKQVPILGSYHPAARSPIQRAKVRTVLEQAARMLGLDTPEEHRTEYKLEVHW